MIDEQAALESLRAMDDARQQQAMMILSALAREFPRREPARLSLVAPAPLRGDDLRKRVQNY